MYRERTRPLLHCPIGSTMSSSSAPERTIFVSSRKSPLAMAQTTTVISMLESRFPALRFVVGQEDTVGDQVLDRHLSDLGTSTASGLFTKSLEEALLAKTAHFAVHSLKDMPTTLPDGLVLAAITKRESPEDAAIVHPKHKAKGLTKLQQLPEKSIIGTSSLRREALIRSHFPSFEVKTLRGNIQTRLAKLDEADEYDAIIVAACGFRRGGLGDRIDEILPIDSFGYGVGQGSIGVECRADDEQTIAMLKTITDEKSAHLCKAERSLLYHLEGGCQIAMGVSAALDGDTLTLNATVLSRDGKNSVHESISGSCTEDEELGKKLAGRFWNNELARQVLGKTHEKRALTYGDAEAPGDAAAAATAAASMSERIESSK
uniref:hydroxymethylbilane synthase n=2 Tax=Peronospora matthiolae TaxID=2874970 RepID=A0AAV1USE7_9STRA